MRDVSIRRPAFDTSRQTEKEEAAKIAVFLPENLPQDLSCVWIYCRHSDLPLRGVSVSATAGE